MWFVVSQLSRVHETNIDVQFYDFFLLNTAQYEATSSYISIDVGPRPSSAPLCYIWLRLVVAFVYVSKLTTQIRKNPHYSTISSS